MQTKPLLYGLIGFFLGGLLVSVAATTFAKPTYNDTAAAAMPMGHMTMDGMTAGLEGKTGDAFDKAFITAMIAHHQGAVAMAELSAQQARHQEIKALSGDIIAAQRREIAEMRQWQAEWGYTSMTMEHGSN